MNLRIPALLLTTALAACQSVPSGDGGGDVAAQRAAIDRHAQAALDKLFASDPSTRAEVESAAGYAVFDVSAVNAVLLVGQRGKGVLVEKTGKRTYMRAVRAGTGPGVGYQQLSQIFAFTSQVALDQFMVAGKAGGDVSASATLGASGVQQSFNPMIRTWQSTEKGFAVQANWGGTAYLVDPDLN